MHRYSLAFVIIAVAAASAPTRAQSTYAMGRPVDVGTPNGGVEYVTQLPKPANETFQALQLAYANLKIPIQADPNQGLVAASNWQVPHRLGGKELSRYFDCGSGRAQSADDLTLTVTIQSSIATDSATAGQSRLTTVVVATATDPQSMSHRMACQTTGQLETRLSDELMKLLAQ